MPETTVDCRYDSSQEIISWNFPLGMHTHKYLAAAKNAAVRRQEVIQSQVVNTCLSQNTKYFCFVWLHYYESISFVDAMGPQSVQTTNSLALLRFSDFVCPLLVMVSATDGGMGEKVMFWWVNEFCHWWPFETRMPPIIKLTVHA